MKIQDLYSFENKANNVCKEFCAYFERNITFQEFQEITTTSQIERFLKKKYALAKNIIVQYFKLDRLIELDLLNIPNPHSLIVAIMLLIENHPTDINSFVIYRKLWCKNRFQIPLDLEKLNTKLSSE